MVTEQSITSDTVAAELDDKDDSIAELVSEGQVIALYADDTEHDYYLLKVQETVHTLESETTDSWGATLPAGIQVITGLYYNNNKQNPLSYKLVSRTRAVVPASAAVYICSELDAKPNIVLQEDVHLNILHAINELFML